MHILARFSIIALSLLALAGCQKTAGSVYGVQATSGVEHTEPVQFNGQRYQVTFKYDSGFAGYDVTVKRPRRPLANSRPDREASIEVMTSALRHFACANGQGASMIEGSASFAESRAWRLKARCA